MKTNIESSLSDGVLHLTFSSNDGLNTMDDHWFALLESKLHDATDDRTVRAVLLSGHGRAFCAGANIVGMRKSALHHGFSGSPLARLIERLMAFPKPLVAAVHGQALGGGATLLLHCDLVVAAADTQFRFPFTLLGAVPEFASSFLLPRAAGSRLASELLLLGNTFDAEKAMRAGIVNELVSPGEELALALQWATHLASLAPDSVQMTKRQLGEAQRSNLPLFIAREGEALVRTLSSGEVKEATSAFLEKRRPDFTPFH